MIDTPPVPIKLVIASGEGWRRETLSCGTCDRGHRRICGIHVATQRKGMIPETPCTRVAAVNSGAPDPKPWRGVADGDFIRDKAGDPREFATAHAAYRAARRASQDQEAT